MTKGIPAQMSNRLHSPRRKRGEGMARNFIREIDRTGLTVQVGKCSDGSTGLKFLNRESYTPEQKALARDLVCLALGYPRNFGTLCRLLRERSAK